jgi:uncharacterized protein (UPF0276 family)
MPVSEDALRRLSLLARRFPIAGHGLELSIGAGGPDEPGYRDALGRVLAASSALWHGDHLCFTRAGGVPIRALTPLPFCEAAIDVAVDNIRRHKRELGAPFVVENIAYYFLNPLSEMDEATFLRRVILGADCALLLDLHNVLVNAINHRYDPYRFVDRLPLDRVVQIHIAGGEDVDGVRLDTHSSFSPEEVWSLLEHVAPRCPVRGLNFEMDSHFPPAARLHEELARARAVLERCGARGA